MTDKPILPLKEAYKFAAENGLADEVEKIRAMEIEWDLSYTSTVKRGYIVDALLKRGIFEEFKAKYWPVGDTPWGTSKTKFFLSIRERYEDFLRSGEQPESRTEELEEAEEQTFAAESDLRDFLAKNPGCIEKGLRIYDSEGVAGAEFSIDSGKGRIDLLAVDAAGRFVVIELKLGRGRNRTLGQLLYYMGWIDKHLSKSAPCRGIIIAKDIPDDLVLAVRRVPDISLCKYTLSVSITPL
jgi:predicted DNA-binding transcriptional regulator